MTRVVYILAMAILLLASVWRGSRGRRETEGFAGTLKCAIAGLMRRPIDLPIWLEHHRRLGITRFYLRLEDTPGLEPYLREQPDVELEMGDSDTQGNNYETLMDRQLRFVNHVMQELAPRDKIDWVFHLDADELLDGDLQAGLAHVPPNSFCATLENMEAVYRDEEPSCFSARTFLRCKVAPCVSYVNGKPCGRVAPGVSLAGPHNFAYRGSIDAHAIPQETLRVLHFDSCTVGSWLEKFAHLSKNAKQPSIPFPYYRESIEAARNATQVYRKFRSQKDHLPSEMLFVRSSTPQPYQ